MTGPSVQSWKSQRDSVAVLAQMALRYSGADGYGVYALEPSSGALIATSSEGTFLPQPDDLRLNPGETLRDGYVVRNYPLRIAGSIVAILAFSFEGTFVSERQTAVLDRMAKSIETLYCLPYAAAELFARVNATETEIAASKISARSQGLLADASQLDPIAAIERHVDTVLGSLRMWTALERLLRDGEEELTERRLASQAKALLQRVHGMTEEKAHHFLRVTSRRTRKPVREIASRVLGLADSTPIKPVERDTPRSLSGAAHAQGPVEA